MTILSLRKEINEYHYPTVVETSLSSRAMVARYDPSGRYIGAGQYSGRGLVWNLETRSVVATLEGHVRPVTSIDWSRNSRFILTSARDWNVIVWDLSSSLLPIQRFKTIRFDAAVLYAAFHPLNSKVLIALLSSGEAFLIDTRPGQPYRTELWEKVEEPNPITVVRFHPHGKLVFAGTTMGHVIVFNTRTKQMIARHKLSGANSLKHLEFTRSGRVLFTNSTDRTIRQFFLPGYTYVPEDENSYHEQELEAVMRYSDPINKMAWHGVALSPDARWLAGGAVDATGHKIYIWDVSSDGRYTSTLDGGRESMSGLQWHPMLSAMASTTREGNILLWHVPTQENFAAFAGGFDEIDENTEYMEQEDEFDIEDEDSAARRKEMEEEMEVDVDGITETEMEQRRRALEEDSYHAEMQDMETEWALVGADDDEGDWSLAARE